MLGILGWTVFALHMNYMISHPLLLAFAYFMNMAYSNDLQIQGKAYSLSERPVKNDDGIMAEDLGGDRTTLFATP